MRPRSPFATAVSRSDRFREGLEVYRPFAEGMACTGRAGETIQVFYSQRLVCRCIHEIHSALFRFSCISLRFTTRGPNATRAAIKLIGGSPPCHPLGANPLTHSASSAAS
jgi:hypothetical protein